MSQPWEQSIDPNASQAADKLSELVAGNQALTTEPGLVQAMAQGNATPVQAQAINQFLIGLKAEQKVRAAAAASTRIMLSPGETQALDAMGINYAPVYQSPQSALDGIRQQMADKGVQPVMTADGSFKHDANGNIVIQPLATASNVKPAAKPDTGWFSGVGNFFHHLTHNPVTNLIGKGQLDPNNPFEQAPTGEGGVSGAVQLAGKEWGLVSATAQDIAAWTRGSQSVAAALRQNDDLAQSLGYDPSSFFSMAAFKAAGYEHTDLSHLADEWNTKYPNGLNGWDGMEATQQAALFAANPTKWRQQIENDPSNYTTVNGQETLTDAGKAKLNILGSKDFQDLIAQVQSRSSSIGNAVANSLGIDPIAHPTGRAFVSGGAEIAASFALDPLNFGLNAATAASKSTVAIKNLADGESIRQILLAENGIKSMKQANVIHYVSDLVNSANDLRAASTDVERAQIVAKTQANNPLAAYLPEFTGDHQVLGFKQEPQPGEMPFIMGKGKPIETYQDAVDYLASKAGFVRLTGGYSPFESRLMPGAMSNFTYNRFKGALANWSAGRTAERTAQNTADYLGWAQADPARLQTALNDGHIAKLDPQLDDAIDPATGELMFPDNYAVTSKGLGQIRRNELTYGGNPDQMSTVGKVIGWGTKGLAARARLALTRLGNQLPTSTTVHIDDNSSVWAIRKVARTYLTSGDTDLLAAQYVTGDAETRKTIVEGLKDAIGEAAGLSKTRAGRDLMQRWKTENQAYAMRSDLDWKDANGTPVALWPGQVQTEFRLPQFGQVHQAAVKAGLYEATLGRMLTNRWLDRLVGQWKVGILARPVTAMRAILESHITAAMDGMFGKALQSKAVARDLGRLDDPELGLERLKGTEKLAQWANIIPVARFYRHVMEANLTPEQLEEHINFPLDLEATAIHEQAAFNQALTLDPAGLSDITQGAELGLKPGRLTFDPKNAWDGRIRRLQGYELTDEVDGQRGADTYAQNLAVRVNKNPALAKAVIAHLKGEDDGSLQGIIDQLDKDPAMRHSMYGKKVDFGASRAVTPDDVDTGKIQWAQTLVADMEKLLTGRNGQLNDKIIGQIRATGKAPSADWILDHVKGMDRPEQLLKPIYIDSTFEGTPEGLVKKLYEAENRAYQRLVEMPVNRHATMPLFRAATVDAKLALNETLKPQLIAEGMSEETADRIAWDIAAGQGWARVGRLIDNPHNMRTQMDIVGRGFFAFSRATTSMIRRFGGIFWRNPVQARRLQLAIEGATQSGIVHKDENGDWVTSIPLSGVAMEVLQHAMSFLPGFQGMVYSPTVDLQGRVTTIIPGAADPFQYSTTPMVSLPARWIASHFPQNREWFDHVDTLLNGKLGQGRGIVDTLEPSIIKDLVTDPGFMGGNDPQAIRNQMLASAMVGQLYTMYAAGNVPTEAEMADPAKRQKWLDQYKRGVMSNLFTKGVFSMFSPATLDSPEGDGFPADEAWRVTGARDLRAEFKEILNDVNGDFGRANAIWARLHPDLMVFAQSGSQGMTKDASLPATDATMQWLAVNKGFVNDYKQVAAYFVPPAKANAPFSLDAYHAELEEGLRQRKTPDEFLQGIKLADDMNAYFDGGHGFVGEAKYKAALAAAQASGNQDAVRQVKQDWQIASKNYQETHPLFQAWLQNHDQGGIVAQGQIAELKRMVKNGAVPGGEKTALVLKAMLANYDEYEGYLANHPADGTNLRTQQRQAALAMYQDYMAKAVTEAPDLMGVYNGVFRVLNSNLDPITNGAANA